MSQTIHIQDTIAPVAPAAPAAFNGQCASDMPAPVSLTANDNCDGVLTVQPVDGARVPDATGCGYTVTRTWTFTDACGNSSSVSQTIHIQDTIAPTISGVPTGSNLGCNPGNLPTDASVKALLAATDNCGTATITVTHIDSGTDCAKTRTFTITASDVCDNAMTPVTVVYTWKIDTTAPVMTGLPSATASYQCRSDVPAAPTVTANDNCDGALSVTYNQTSVTNGCVVTITRTWRAVDTCGTPANFTQTITVRDTIPPVITCPPDRELGCEGSTNPSQTGTATATDNCAPAPTVTYSDTSVVNSAGNTVITRTWTATDACGNQSTCVQTITTGQAGGCIPGTFTFSGSSSGSGAVNIRTFTAANGVSVKVSAFGRSRDTGAWDAAYVGIFSGGLGVTDNTENGGDNSHTVDNIGRDNYLLFEFSQPVIVDRALLGYVVQDSDMNVWVGTFADPYNNHLTLSDSVLGSFGFTEENTTTLATTRTADFNAGQVVGNAFVISAWLSDPDPEDQFKVNTLEVCKPACQPVTNCVQKADASATCGTSGGHALYLPGIGTDFVFTPTAGTFVEYPNGTAQMSGTVASVSNPGKGFNVSVSLSGLTSVPPAGSPKKELQACAYIENGGPVNPATWKYYTSFTGTLTGVGSYAGASLSLVRTGPAFQVGVGANGKNLLLGASSWFLWTVTTQPSSGSALPTTGQGDFNLNVNDCTVPPPTCTGSICGSVLRDCDADGSLTGEAGLSGWTVTLKTTGGSTVATTTTSANGSYCFNNLAAGTYDVVVTPQANYVATYGCDAANKIRVVLASCQNKTGINYGYTGKAPGVNLVVTGPSTATCGQTITYTFAVTNTGNTCLYGGMRVEAALLGGQIFHQTPVTPGSGFVFTKTYVVKTTDSTPLILTATAIGDPPGSLANVTKVVTVSTVVSCAPTPPGCIYTYPISGCVNLTWPACSGATSYTVKRCNTRDGSYTVIKTGITTTNCSDYAVVNGNCYYYKVCAVKGSASSADCEPKSAIPCATLPSPWRTRDIGTCADNGGASYANSQFTVIGSGEDIWNTSDEFRYVYQTASGDCTVVARVTSIGNTDQWAKAGVMIRENLTAGAKHASTFVTPGNGVAFQWRNATGGASGNVNTTGLTAPRWLKIVRTGNTFTSSYSATGASGSWTTFATQTISMGSSVYIGLGVTAHNDGALCPAVFSNVTATP